MKRLDVVAAILLMIGGLNRGLVSVANFDLVAALTGAGGFGSRNVPGTIVYGLVGLAAVHQAIAWRGTQRRWRSAA